jgi:hypothetical protein
MRRIENWPEKLFALVEARANAPFEWGVHDCCIFSADVIAEITGIDLMAEYRGRYDSALSAARLFERDGLEAAIEAACAATGFAEHAGPLSAQRGDLVITEIPERGPAAGLCLGATAVFVAPTGISEIPIAQCRRAWAII